MILLQDRWTGHDKAHEHRLGGGNHVKKKAYRGTSVQCYMATFMGWEFRGERMHICVCVGLFAINLKLSQHCQSAISLYKTKT